MKKFLMVIMLFSSSSTNVFADLENRVGFAYIKGGTICDTKKQVIQHIINLNRGTKFRPAVPVVGCAWYIGKPRRVPVIFLDTFEDQFIIVQLASFLFPKPLGVQYGWLHVTVKQKRTDELGI